MIMDEFFPNDSCQHYISLLQDNINRMAANSSSCKTWMITLVAAIFAVGLIPKDLCPDFLRNSKISTNFAPSISKTELRIR